MAHFVIALLLFIFLCDCFDLSIFFLETSQNENWSKGVAPKWRKGIWFGTRNKAKFWGVGGVTWDLSWRYDNTPPGCQALRWFCYFFVTTLPKVHTTNSKEFCIVPTNFRDICLIFLCYGVIKGLFTGLLVVCCYNFLSLLVVGWPPVWPAHAQKKKMKEKEITNQLGAKI